MAALNDRSQVAEAGADETAGEALFAAGLDPFISERSLNACASVLVNPQSLYR